MLKVGDLINLKPTNQKYTEVEITEGTAEIESVLQGSTVDPVLVQLWKEDLMQSVLTYEDPESQKAKVMNILSGPWIIFLYQGCPHDPDNYPVPYGILADYITN